MAKKWRTDFSEYYEKTRNAFKSPRLPSFNFPLNKTFVLLLIVVITIGGLSFFNYRTGKIVNILQQNTTDLQAQLDECNSKYQTCSDDLTTCKNSLLEKSNALTSCNTNLDDCNEAKNEYKHELNRCESDLGDYNDCKDDLDDCQNDLEDYKDILSISQAREFDDFIHNKNVNDFFEFLKRDDVKIDDLDELISGWESLQKNYAEYYCCCVKEIYNTTTNMTYYKFTGSPAVDLDCYDEYDSGRTDFNCTEITCA